MIYYCLPALSDTIWHESNHHPPLIQSSIDTILITIQVLSRLWLHWKVMPWAQPFYNIKEYFGEKTGMYFLFQGHYTRWLIGPAILGLVLSIASVCYPTLKEGFNAPYVTFLYCL